MALVQPSTLSVRHPTALAARTPLSLLVSEIDRACGEPARAMRSRILEALKGAHAADILSPDQRRTRPDRYARHVLYGDPGGRFTILSLVWAPGQFSPVHAHHAWCAYLAHEGTLEETIYGFDSAAMKAHPLRTRPRHAGYCCFDQAGPDHIHRLGNGGAEPALSIHVYGVARQHIETRVNRLVDA